MRSTPGSAAAFLQRIAADAHAAAGVPPPPAPPEQPPEQQPLLVPIFVGVDRPHNPAPVPDAHLPEHVRETFLYKLGDKDWSVGPAVSRLLMECDLSGSYERVLKAQVAAGIAPFAGVTPGEPRREQLVQLQLYVPLGEQAFRDELAWDVGNPLNAHAHAYAARVCLDLGLDSDAYKAIIAALDARLAEVKQDLQEAPEEVQLLSPRLVWQPPGTQGAPGQGRPRLEPLGGAAEAEEATRAAAREAKLAARRARLGAAAAPVDGQQQQQQQQQGTQRDAEQQEGQEQQRGTQQQPQQQQLRPPPQEQQAEQQQQQQRGALSEQAGGGAGSEQAAADEVESDMP